MSGYVVIDKDGWVQEIYEGVKATAFNHIPISNAHLLRQIENMQFIMFWDGKQFCQVKDRKAIWKRIRANNITGDYARRDYDKLIGLVNNSFPGIPAGTQIGSFPALQKHIKPPYEFEFQPGLKICASTEDDIDIWESQMISSGLYNALDAYRLAGQWLSDPQTWNVKVVWRDRILQLENYHFAGNNIAWNGFMAHIDRSRPQWFYRQMATPILKALYAEGIETIMASVRGDRKDWAEYLKRTYGSEILKTTEKEITFRTKIKDSMALIPEWPKRKTLGPDWKWQKDGVLVREATEADFPSIYAAIDKSWGDNPRKQLAISLFEDGWALDEAAILLTIKGEEVVEAVTIRERKDPTVSLINRLLRPIVADIGRLEWQKAVGYKFTSFIIETSLWEQAKKDWRKEWIPYDKALTEWSLFDDDYTECRMNIDEVLEVEKNELA